ncbi:MAG: serine/threonine-protein kinase, partial [Myxococcota bacterium]
PTLALPREGIPGVTFPRGSAGYSTHMETPLRGPAIGHGRYLLGPRLGEGGQAVVFRGFDKRLGVDRAIKILLPRYAAKSKVRARFTSEAQAMARLEHPNIVRVYDVEPDATLPYLVMELATGGSLAGWLESYGAFPARQAVDVAIAICAGAGAAHAASIVHRDIKPQNVLVGHDGVCKLTDFGIARIESSHRTRVGAAMGTEGYMAPEQGRDASTVDPRSDVYGIGITLFVLATGRDPIEWLATRGGDLVPGPLRTVIEAATARDPEDRYPTANALADALCRIRAHLPDAEPHPLTNGLPTWLGDTAGGPDDFADVVAVLDRREVAAAPAPAPIRPATPVELTSDPPTRSTQTYLMPRPVKKYENTPDYVDRGSKKAAAPHGFVVALDENEKRLTRKAQKRRARADSGRSRSPSIDDRLGDGSSEGTRARWSPVRAIFHPVAVLAAVILLGAAIAGWFGWSAWAATEATHRADDARGRMHAAIDPATFRDLDRLGADRAAIDDLYAQWRAAREPDKTGIAVALIDLVTAEADRVDAARAAPDETVRQLGKLREARDAYRATLDRKVSRW